MFKVAMQDWAIGGEHKIAMCYKKSDATRNVVICTQPDCPFRISATFDKTHGCVKCCINRSSACVGHTRLWGSFELIVQPSWPIGHGSAKLTYRPWIFIDTPGCAFRTIIMYIEIAFLVTTDNQSSHFFRFSNKSVDVMAMNACFQQFKQ